MRRSLPPLPFYTFWAIHDMQGATPGETKAVPPFALRPESISHPGHALPLRQFSPLGFGENVVQDEDGPDQSQVGEALRKVAQVLPLGAQLFGI
jgi:hypothetical protein